MTPSFFGAIALLAVVATSATANPMLAGANPMTHASELQARAGGNLPLNPTDAVLRPLEMVLTNGQRLARGLPLKKPHARRADRTTHARPRRSATPATATTQTAADGCRPRTGVVHVTSDAEPGLDGFLSNHANEFGEYGYTTERRDALLVTVNNCTGSPFDIVSSNGFKAFPYVGGIKGFSSDSPELRSGSSNYAYIGGVTQTTQHSGPQSNGNSFSEATKISEPSESAIWTFRNGGDVLEPRWVDSDGSSPEGTLAYVPSEKVFVLVGDIGVFRQAFGDISEATFNFES